MKATEAKLLDFIKKSPQFVIPIYQRTYSWTKKECQKLWDDILTCGNNDYITAHFMGSVVYIEQGIYSVSSQSPLSVIDGQQRITSTTLLIAALIDVIGDDEPVEDFNKSKLNGYYLTNPLEGGERYYKIILSKTDNLSLKSIVNGTEQPRDSSLRIFENFEFFKSKLKSTPDLKAICNGLSKLMIVDISLNREQDNPQLIFESMNSTGKELSQADLIRNYILMGIEPDQQTYLYETYWQPMEVAFGQQAYSEHFDSFMRHYLTIKTREIPKINDVYDKFKDLSKSPNIANLGVERLVSDIKDHAIYFCAFALGKETDSQLSHAFKDIRELKVEVSYPLILEMYADYKREVINHEELLSAIRIVESYIFRRAICDIPTNSMNKTFSKIGLEFKKEDYLESVKKAFAALPSYRRFPSDKEFHSNIQTKDVYNFRNKAYWLRRMENFGRKERIFVGEYTVEHIMPQSGNNSDKLSSRWRDELGDDWETTWGTYRHTIGNLTLTGYNSEYSDNSFSDKCNHEFGFKFSPLKMNQGIAQEDRWDKNAIERRARRLADKAVLIWANLGLPDSEIEKSVKTESNNDLGYTIQDHPHLLSSDMSYVFNALSEKILSIDPCVKRVFTKLYVAFKAETNFVDIVPQAKNLRVTLNIPFREIDDPKGVCRDVSNIGRWGNGDVDIAINKVEDIPYVMALIMQSFERQMRL